MNYLLTFESFFLTDIRLVTTKHYPTVLAQSIFSFSQPLIKSLGVPIPLGHPVYPYTVCFRQLVNIIYTVHKNCNYSSYKTYHSCCAGCFIRPK